MSEFKTRIDAAAKRRDELATRHQRLLGRLEESERALEAVREDCRSKNLDPDKLDEIVSKLESAIESSLSQFESQLSAAESALKPYL
jgi:DNA repair exonuclease SbcCD ATPase subunit